MEVSGGGVEYSGGMEVSSMEERPATQSPCRRPPRPPHLPLPRLQIDYILIIAVDDVGSLMDGPCDVDASSSCVAMRWSSAIRCKTDLAI